MRSSLLVVAILLLSVGSAAADCESGIAALTPKVATVTNVHTRALLESDLRRAQRDLWEFDEVECAVVLEHADRLLRLGT